MKRTRGVLIFTVAKHKKGRKMFLQHIFFIVIKEMGSSLEIKKMFNI